MTLYVVEGFTSKDSLTSYKQGDKFTEDASDERLKVLTSSDNAIGKPVLVNVDESSTKKELVDAAHKLNIEIDEKDTKADILNSFK